MLKSQKRMTLLIRDIGKIPYSCSYNNYPQSSSSWHAGDSSTTGTSINKHVKKNSTLSSIEDRARFLLSRNHFLNLIHNISEYGGRLLPVETFVTIILELLDTPEKVTNISFTHSLSLLSSLSSFHFHKKLNFLYFYC
jgi:whirlin